MQRLVAHPSAATVGRGEFLNTTGRSTSLAVGSPIPCPPAAAPAAGGWGIVDPRPVYSVGSSWSLAGGAEEEAVRPARRFGAKISLSGGGALWSPVVMSSSSPSSEICGSGEFVSPSPALAWRSSRSLKKKEEEVLRSLAMKMVGCGVSSLELATGDFPSAEGRHLIQAIMGCSGGGAPPAASCSSSTSRFRGLGCNFSFLLDLFVRCATVEHVHAERHRRRLAEQPYGTTQPRLLVHGLAEGLAGRADSTFITAARQDDVAACRRLDTAAMCEDASNCSLKLHSLTYVRAGKLHDIYSQEQQTIRGVGPAAYDDILACGRYGHAEFAPSATWPAAAMDEQSDRPMTTRSFGAAMDEKTPSSCAAAGEAARVSFGVAAMNETKNKQT